MYLKLEQNSSLLTFNICIHSRLCLRSNSITVFSTSTHTRLGIFHPVDFSRCVELLQRLQLEINSLNRKKKKDAQTNLNKEGIFQHLNVFLFCSLRLTFKYNVLFGLVINYGLVCTENRRKRLKGFQKRLNTSLRVLLNSSNSHGCKLKL